MECEENIGFKNFFINFYHIGVKDKMMTLIIQNADSSLLEKEPMVKSIENNLILIIKSREIKYLIDKEESL